MEAGGWRALVRAESMSLADALGLVRPRLRHVLAAFLAAPALVSEAVCALETRLALDLAPWAPIPVFDLSPAARVLLLAVSPAIGEELYFRGALLERLRRSFSVRLCVLFDAVLFGAAYLGAGCVLPAVLLGGALTWLPLRSRSVVPALPLHAVHNALVLFAEDIGGGLGSRMSARPSKCNSASETR